MLHKKSGLEITHDLIDDCIEKYEKERNATVDTISRGDIYGGILRDLDEGKKFNTLYEAIKYHIDNNQYTLHYK